MLAAHWRETGRWRAVSRAEVVAQVGVVRMLSGSKMRCN